MLKKYFLALDVYGKPFSFRMQHGYTTHRSMLGACSSVLLIVITIMYATSRINILINHEQSKLAIWNYDNYLDDSFIFDTKEYGFNIAFGLVANDYLYSKESVTDEDYGSLQFKLFSWSPTHFSEETIPVRTCTAEDFGLGETDKSNRKFA